MSTAKQREASFRAKAPWIMELLKHDFVLDLNSSAAAVGNLGHECAGFTLMQEQKPTVAGSRGGYGWAQWTGPRRKLFEAYCARNNLDPKSDRANYGFLFVELSGSERSAIPAVKKAKTLRAKVEAFEKNFERAGVKHYDSREQYAKWALDAYAKASPAQKAAPYLIEGAPVAAEPEPDDEPETAPEIPVVARPSEMPPKPPATILGRLWAHFTGNPVGITNKTAKVELNARPGLAPGGDPALYDAQKRFVALGYTEVGDPDGLMGRKTRTAVSLFREDQGLPAGSTVDDAVLAALLKAEPLPPNAKRATLQAKDLREAGNAPVKAFDKLRLGGIGGILLGALGGADSSGALDAAKAALATGNDTLAQAQSIMGQVQSGIAMIVSIVQWCIHHWWIFVVIGAFFFLKWVLKGTLELVILGRQSGLLQLGSRK